MRHIRLLFAFLSLLTGVMATEVVYANPPYIDYMFTKVDWPLDSCLKDARNTMKHVGFKEIGSTGNHELVGVKDEYKSVIACIDTNNDDISELTLFIVSGPSHKQAAILNTKQKEYWDTL